MKRIAKRAAGVAMIAAVLVPMFGSIFVLMGIRDTLVVIAVVVIATLLMLGGIWMVFDE